MKTIQADIKDRVVALRLALQQEHFMPNEYRYREPDYDDQVKPLVINIDKYLMDKGYEDKDKRREKRLGILSFIVQREVKTTYDLTKKEAQVIIQELVRDEKERQSQLMEFLSTRS